MGKITVQNFQERFKGGISVAYPDKPLSSMERSIQNEAISKAVFQVMASILGREPTQEEFSGAADITKSVPRRKT